MDACYKAAIAARTANPASQDARDLEGALFVALYAPELYAFSKAGGPTVGTSTVVGHRPRDLYSLGRGELVANDERSKVGLLLAKLHRAHAKREVKAGVDEVEAIEVDSGVQEETVYMKSDGVSLLVTVEIIEVAIVVSAGPRNKATFLESPNSSADEWYSAASAAKPPPWNPKFSPGSLQGMQVFYSVVRFLSGTCTACLRA